MSDMMTQEEAMNMSNEQAVQILIPMRNMMCDQHGCPISDAVFALDKAIEALSADRPQEWIPCSERLPKDLEVVNITWVNHRPVCYYSDIKDKPFTATAIHYKDKWWWYSPICEDMLAEYGKSECDKMDADIEVTAWMPLPKPYEEVKENE